MPGVPSRLKKSRQVDTLDIGNDQGHAACNRARAPALARSGGLDLLLLVGLRLTTPFELRPLVLDDAKTSLIWGIFVEWGWEGKVPGRGPFPVEIPVKRVGKSHPIKLGHARNGCRKARVTDVSRGVRPTNWDGSFNRSCEPLVLKNLSAEGTLLDLPLVISLTL